MNLQEERLSGKHVFKGRIIDLEVDQIQLPDGHNSIREVINHPGGVAIAALNERDELLMVRQFRYPFRTVLLELPAVRVGAGSGFQQRKRLEVVRQHQPFTSGNIRK